MFNNRRDLKKLKDEYFTAAELGDSRKIEGILNPRNNELFPVHINEKYISYNKN